MRGAYARTTTRNKKVRANMDPSNRAMFEHNKKIILATQSICAICGKPVDKSIKYPDPMSPTVDHIIPLAKNGDLKGATEYVNKTRGRAGLAGIPQPADEGAMIDAILAERRLELSFEGFRFYDLVRHGKAAAVAASVAADSYWRPRRALTPQTILFPIPVSALEQNPNLKQNEGY